MELQRTQGCHLHGFPATGQHTLSFLLYTGKDLWLADRGPIQKDLGLFERQGTLTFFQRYKQTSKHDQHCIPVLTENTMIKNCMHHSQSISYTFTHRSSEYKIHSVKRSWSIGPLVDTHWQLEVHAESHQSILCNLQLVLSSTAIEHERLKFWKARPTNCSYFLKVRLTSILPSAANSPVFS